MGPPGPHFSLKEKLISIKGVGGMVLAQNEAVPQHALPYLNRLSDLLFVLSRCINRVDAANETLWQRDS